MFHIRKRVRLYIIPNKYKKGKDRRLRRNLPNFRSPWWPNLIAVRQTEWVCYACTQDGTKLSHVRQGSLKI